MADAFANQVTIQPATEQGSRALVESSHMPVDTARLSVSYLHRGEVTVSIADDGPQQIGRCGASVDLDPGQGATIHGLTLPTLVRRTWSLNDRQ
jgi:hypothetical protein